MGHIVNPISFRLGWFSFWSSTSVVCNFKEYSYLFLSDFNLHSFFNWFFKKFSFYYKFNFFSFYKLRIFYVNLKLLRINNFLYLYFFCFDKNLYDFLYYVLYLFKYPDFKNKYKFYYLNSLSFLKKSKSSSYMDFKLQKIISKFFFKKLYIFLINFWIQIFKLISVYFFKLFKGLIVNFNLFLLKNKFISASLVSNFIIGELQKRVYLKRVINNLHKDFYKGQLINNNIIGYKIICSGRFDRKTRATYFWKHNGNTPFNSVYVQVDYWFDSVILKYGTCGVKVFIFKSKSNFLNMYLPLCTNYVKSF